MTSSQVQPVQNQNEKDEKIKKLESDLKVWKGKYHRANDIEIKAEEFKRQKERIVYLEKETDRLKYELRNSTQVLPIETADKSIDTSNPDESENDKLNYKELYEQAVQEYEVLKLLPIFSNSLK